MNAPGRNQPCPCGSGRRYKDCHGALGGGPADPAAHARAEGTRLLHEALAHQQGKRLDDARRLYEQGLALLPDAADGWHMLGVIALERDDIEAAHAHVVRALDLTDWRIGAMRHNLGLILARVDEDAASAAAREIRQRYRAWYAQAAPGPAVPPLVSVVMPSYNHAAYVERALRSVFTQSHRALELIVVDDGSTDASPGVIERCLRDAPFPSRFERRNNAGAAAAINRGIELATGAYVNLLNSDDAFMPERIERMVAATAVRDAAWGFSGIAVIDADDHPIDPLTDRRAFDLLCSVHAVPLQETVGFALLSQNVAVSSGNLFFSRVLAEKVGPFGQFRYNHDWDFCLRALAHAEPVFVPDALYRYRLHGANTIVESATRARDEANRICADYLGWARMAEAPANPFAPAVATWGALFVNAVLGSGMGELLNPEVLKELTMHPATIARGAAST
jgi:glycosyltransferase involved in cell wall biosynthesis